MPGKMKRIKKRDPVKIILLVSMCLFSVLAGKAQDLQFSLPQMNPLFINAANTGNFKGNWRISANFRNQQVVTAEPFRTASASVDGKLNIVGRSVGAGLFIVNDESGIGGLNYNKVYASLGYRFDLNNNYISIGVQPGYVFAAVNDWNTWDNTSGSFSAPSGEENFNESANYLDINLGILWSRSIGIADARLGVNFFHINKPAVSFLEGDDREDLMSLVNAGVKINLTDRLYLEPSFLLMARSGVSLTSLGSMIGYKMPGNKTSLKNVFGGFYIQNGLLDELNTLALTAGVTINRIDLGIAYDMNIGNYSVAAGSMGAFEIAVIYRNITTVLNSYSIPCERY